MDFGRAVSGNYWQFQILTWCKETPGKISILTTLFCCQKSHEISNIWHQNLEISSKRNNRKASLWNIFLLKEGEIAPKISKIYFSVQITCLNALIMVLKIDLDLSIYMIWKWQRFSAWPVVQFCDIHVIYRRSNSFIRTETNYWIVPLSKDAQLHTNPNEQISNIFINILWRFFVW